MYSFTLPMLHFLKMYCNATFICSPLYLPLKYMCFLPVFLFFLGGPFVLTVLSSLQLLKKEIPKLLLLLRTMRA